jgi:hypothetical protein
MAVNGIISLTTTNARVAVLCLFAFWFQSGQSWSLLLVPLHASSTVRLRQHHSTVSTTTTALYVHKHQHQHHHHHHQNNEEERGVFYPLNKQADDILRLPSSSRREWFSKIVAKTAAASSLVTAAVLSSSATAATAAPNVVISTAVCDSSVSVWQLPAVAVAVAAVVPEDVGGIAAVARPTMDRLIYLLGTAHISEVSAQLAGQLVRDTHPNAVFVELDLKRVGGLGTSTSGTSGTSGSSGSSSSKIVIPAPYSAASSATTAVAASTSSTSVLTAQEDGGGMVAETAIVAVAAPPASSSSLPPTSPPPLLPPSSQPQPFSFRQGILNMGAAAVGNAIRSMYKNLDDAGFKPGDEFAMAIEAGRDINADIVLGDQDVQLTLRRLTQALAATDINKLMDPDSDLERNMRQLIGGSSNAGGNELSLPGMPTTAADGTTAPHATTNAEFKRDLSAYIEVIKTRESVRSIMKQLNEVAPALVQVMLTERDAYMATGLDTLNQYEVITAVVGVAHQDGIEANLRQRGWKQVALKCPNRAR